MDEKRPPSRPAPSGPEVPSAAALTETAAAGPQDLSSEIESAVEREPLDRVRCVHLYGDRYRCNWWAPGEVDATGPQAEWAIRAMHRVRKSRFISARSVAGELVMEDVTSNRS